MNGFAEVTVFALILHDFLSNAERAHQRWLRRMPDLPGLHTAEDVDGFDSLIEVNTGSNFPITNEDNKKEQHSRAPDLAFSSMIWGRGDTPSIIFEVAYSQNIKEARTKALVYLFDVEREPRPCVIVLIDIKYEGGKVKDRNVVCMFPYLSFLLRYTSSEQNHVHEKGNRLICLLWPRTKGTEIVDVTKTAELTSILTIASHFRSLSTSPFWEKRDAGI